MVYPPPPPEPGHPPSRARRGRGRLLSPMSLWLRLTIRLSFRSHLPSSTVSLSALCVSYFFRLLLLPPPSPHGPVLYLPSCPTRYTPPSHNQSARQSLRHVQL